MHNTRTLIPLILFLFISSHSFAFLECINEQGEKAFSDSTCPDGYKIIKDNTSYQEVKGSTSYHSGQTPDHENNEKGAQEIMDKVKIIVLDRKKIDLPKLEELPKKGNTFLTFLIQVSNDNTDTTIHGGSSDHSSSFSLKTSDGFTTTAVNTSSDFWRDTVRVYSGDDLYPGDKNKGWIVFEIPKHETPERLAFDVSIVNSYHHLTGLGKVWIDF